MKFAPNRFFSVCNEGGEEFICRDLFDGVQAAWQVLGDRLVEYISANLRREINGEIADGAWLSDDVFIGEGTVVEFGAMIKGPAIIGRNCQIRHGAYVRENVIVGDGCVVGHATELKGCVLLNHVEAGHFAYIGDSIVGSRSMLGAGTKLANYRFDGGEIFVYDGDARHPTGLNKFGAIVGDRCAFGCNSVSYPGTVLGTDCSVMPCTSVRGYIESDTDVF